MRYLIDGYNLMYALSIVPPRGQPVALQPLRDRFLHMLSTRARSKCSTITIVFDAKDAPVPSVCEGSYREMTLLFTNDEMADDRIETMIREECDPPSLSVVSDDRRLQKAARRRGCLALECLDFYESLGEPEEESPRAVVSTTEEPNVSEEETRKWLEEFGIDPDEEDVPF